MILLLISTMAIAPFEITAEPIASGFRFTEGPTLLKDGGLLFSDIPADRLYVLRDGKAEVFREPSHNANGNTLDPEGRIVTCEHGNRRVSRTEKDGTVVALAERWEGKRLNSPNDIVVAPDDTIYFTDPPYGISPDKEELGFYALWRLQGGELKPLVRDFVRPNGLAFSPDGRTLYVDDTDRKHIRAFDVTGDGVGNGRVFAEVKGDAPGAPDGMRVDREGNVWCTGSGGVQVFNPQGEKIGQVKTAEVSTNCEFGGSDLKTLYVTAGTSVYAARVPFAGRAR